MQLVKYGIVGVTHNTIGYLAYLGLTYLGGEPKLVMTLGYAIGVYVSFTLNKSLTFSYTGPNKSAFIRFSIAHVFGYATNFMMLYVLVDKMHYNHAIIQIMAILVVSVLLFTLFKLYVFPASDKSNRDTT